MEEITYFVSITETVRPSRYGTRSGRKGGAGCLVQAMDVPLSAAHALADPGHSGVAVTKRSKTRGRSSRKPSAGTGAPLSGCIERPESSSSAGRTADAEAGVAVEAA